MISGTAFPIDDISGAREVVSIAGVEGGSISASRIERSCDKYADMFVNVPTAYGISAQEHQQ
jgi:hypothetical protein